MRQNYEGTDSLKTICHMRCFDILVIEMGPFEATRKSTLIFPISLGSKWSYSWNRVYIFFVYPVHILHWWSETPYRARPLRNFSCLKDSRQLAWCYRSARQLIALICWIQILSLLAEYVPRRIAIRYCRCKSKRVEWRMCLRRVPYSVHLHGVSSRAFSQL